MVRETMFRFVHITDTHIMAGGTWRIRGTDVEFDTDASLRRVVETVRRLQPAPAFAVLGGDLASPDILHRERTLTPAEYAPSYARLREILGELPCRAHFLMGNHDNLEAFNRALRPEASVPDAPCYYSFDHDGTPSSYDDEKPDGRAFVYRLWDSFRLDPHAHLFRAGEPGVGGKVFDVEGAAMNTASSPLRRELRGRHLQMIAIGGSIGKRSLSQS